MFWSELAKNTKLAVRNRSSQEHISHNKQDFHKSECRTNKDATSVESAVSENQSRKPASSSKTIGLANARTYVVRSGMLLDTPPETMSCKLNNAANKNSAPSPRLRDAHAVVWAVGQALIIWNIIFFNILGFSR